MHTSKLSCAGPECGAAVLVQTQDAKPEFNEIAELAYEQGWRMSRSQWFCGERCARNSAANTPSEKEIAVEALDKLQELNLAFNMSRLAMDDDARKTAGEIHKEVSGFIESRRAILETI